MRILISGACGVTSRAIARSIKLSDKYKDADLIGTDICENAFGLFEGLFERIWRVPRVSDPEYPKMFNSIIQKENIDCVILIPELEVLFWTKNKLETKSIVPPPKFSDLAISKGRLFAALAHNDFVPKSEVIDTQNFDFEHFESSIDFPYWIRGISEGSTSGKGSMLVKDQGHLIAWSLINKETKEAMISEYLPGRNIAVHLLYSHGNLLKVGCYERLEYFKKDVSLSGITGNISKGKLINDDEAVKVAQTAVEELCKQTGEKMNGIVAVDLKGSKDGKHYITEINIRHVAATSSFALGGFNLTEFQLDVMNNDMEDWDDEAEKIWPINNIILRDIDGRPLLVEDFKLPKFGESYPI
jgi:carbamoyl-phosphate synthase large subunit